ncbi:XTP/dITP diphosphatase [uncultured Methanomethylovorans sp.]|uniref:XTP/dITP diphosphatase n=1 Tax=uncultured Methanomethylovorans sp. TaxID=183759 RepID=UPI002AA72144|nr:XTP/dITP diphosphatase [uncultured Methanomethylovorans sp.]
MRNIVFVTGNKGKFNEAISILEAKHIELLQNTGGYPELQEDDLEPIASFGAKWAAEKLQIPVMVDDSGLFINALNGFPGPYSAFVENKMGNKKVLKLMEDEENRTAVFKSVIGYCEPGKEAIVFTGTVEGIISFEERGTGGFGYDPIFEYNGRTFAEMGDEEKNTLSHRRRALDKFFEWLPK